MKEILLLVGHGSRDADGNREFLQFVNNVQQEMPEHEIVSCFLELADPDIPAGIRHCIEKGATRIVVVPVILLAASHVKLEIPEFLDMARKQYPGVEIVYGRHLGLHQRILDLLVERYELARNENQLDPNKDTAIVLMGRGSSDPDANGDIYKIARLLWERTKVLTVETCFSGITTPLLPGGVQRAVALGAKQIVIVPYFLFTGVLIKRMRGELAQLQSQFPDVSIGMAEYFGFHDYLLDIVKDRIKEACVGESFMNCDMCKYRLQIELHHHIQEHNHSHHHEHNHNQDHHGHHEHKHEHITATK